MTRHCITILFLSLFTLLFPIPSRALDADEPVGQIDQLAGTVTLIRADGQETAPKPELSLYPGDRIITGDDGSLSFSYTGGSRFELGPSSEIAVDELSTLEEDESTPVLRLVLGHLRSTFSGLFGTEDVIQTPTTTIGIRGTTFDTVVALDTTTAVAVDEGSVSMDWEEEQQTVETGRMVQLDALTTTVSPSAAPPQSRRNWSAWQTERREELVRKLPLILPAYQNRIEIARKQFFSFSDEIQMNSKDLLTEVKAFGKELKEMQKELKEAEREARHRKKKAVRDRAGKFKGKVRKLRKKKAKIQCISSHSSRIAQFIRSHPDLYSDTEREKILNSLHAIHQQGNQIQVRAAEIKPLIRQTKTELRELRKSIKEMEKMEKKRNKSEKHGKNLKKKEKEKKKGTLKKKAKKKGKSKHAGKKGDKKEKSKKH